SPPKWRASGHNGRLSTPVEALAKPAEHPTGPYPKKDIFYGARPAPPGSFNKRFRSRLRAI
ncbi:MAG TPA: hypothetical protein PK365_20015, partial [Nitrospira sp.]|nr:hypothetical protein [Nitrospira sp.]